MTRLPSLLGALVVLSLTGCLEREETLQVRADGSVDVVHKIQGDVSDFTDGRAGVPTSDDFVLSEKDTRTNGRARRVLTAAGRFPSADSLPSSFGEGPRAFQFTTRLLVEEEQGGTRFTLVRTYAPRRWSAYSYQQAHGVTEGIQRVLSGSSDDRDRVDPMQAMIGAERGKSIQLADDALFEIARGRDELPRAMLALREEIDAFFTERVTPDEVKRLLDMPEQDRSAATAALRRDLDAALGARAAETLDLDEDERRALSAALTRHRSALEVTEDLADEAFVVRARLPGEVQFHNGKELEAGTLEWRFAGKDLFDRSHTLIASSLLAEGGAK